MPDSEKENDLDWDTYVKAASLGLVSTDTVRRWVRLGKVRSRRVGASSRVQVCLDDIRKMIDSDVPAA